MNETHVRQIIDKLLALSFNWEVIKEIFKETLALHIHANKLPLNAPYLKASLDYKAIFNFDKVLEKTLHASIQAENAKSEQNSDSELQNETERLEEQFYSSMDLKNPDQMFKSMMLKQQQPNAGNESGNLKQKQMTYQEYIAQSISKLNDKSNLRPIIIDGNDVGLSNKQVFAFSRIKKVCDYFEKRNHQIYVLLPNWRKEQIMQNNIISSMGSGGGGGQSNNSNHQSTQISPVSTNSMDQEALVEMENKGLIHFTPSKRVGSKHIKCDDDNAILQLAVVKSGIIVSNDNFKRYLNHNDDFKHVILERVLMYSFIDDTFMPVDDPLGKNGPSLDNFLRFESLSNQQYLKRCPYRKRCTYGSKCKFWHPERDPSGQAGGVGGASSQFKTAFQTVLDRSLESRAKFEQQILNKPNNNESQPNNDFLYTNNKSQTQSFQQTFFNNQTIEIEAKKMGPESNSAKLFSPSNQLNKFNQHQKSPYPDWTTNSGPNMMSSFNPITYTSPFNSAVTLLAQQTSHEIEGNVLKSSKVDMSGNGSNHVHISPTRNGNEKPAPPSIRTKLEKILSKAEIEPFLEKYKEESDENKLIFLAHSMKFDLLDF